MSNTNSQTESDHTRVPVGRRDFMKLAAIGAGLSSATVGSVVITGRVQATDQIEAEAYGGQISEFTIDGDDEFEINWTDVGDRGTINFGLEAGIRGEDNHALIGEKQMETTNSSGSTVVTVAEFTDDPDRDQVPLVARHPYIGTEDISVDLDEYEQNSNQKLEVEEIKTIELTITSVHSATRDRRRRGRGRERGRGRGRGPRGRGPEESDDDESEGPGRGRGPRERDPEESDDDESEGPGRGRGPRERDPEESDDDESEGPGPRGRSSEESDEDEPDDADEFVPEGSGETVDIRDSETVEITLSIKPILGCGIYFGEKFAAWNDFGPSESVNIS